MVNRTIRRPADSEGSRPPCGKPLEHGCGIGDRAASRESVPEIVRLSSVARLRTLLVLPSTRIVRVVVAIPVNINPASLEAIAVLAHPHLKIKWFLAAHHVSRDAMAVAGDHHVQTHGIRPRFEVIAPTPALRPREEPLGAPSCTDRDRSQHPIRRWDNPSSRHTRSGSGSQSAVEARD